ncbi:amino acid racemase [Rhizobium sp. AN63]|uniref:aspartate/glutamate racemase family protein n=1 Tax=Rhizobium sp. AN63 TaxID=3035210 RepID=UPI0027D37C19|nr:amino acid racemase [Rhizobium sp. AN63]MDQ4409209.1 amino acid racemase [Rhizobium sp. AN63]
MKTIGFIGGMSWESLGRILSHRKRAGATAAGGVHSAKSLMWSMDFGEIEKLQHDGDWIALEREMVSAAQNLERGGADFLVICTNTMHKLAVGVERAVSIPLLHIADPTAEKIRHAGLTRVGLLGTAFTMEQEFYKGRLNDKFGLDVLIPDADDRAAVHKVIYTEPRRRGYQ